MSAPDPAKKLNALLRRLKAQHAEAQRPPIALDAEDEFDLLVHQLVFSLLLWEASTAQAKTAFRRLRESVVDYNELRVCVPDEVACTLGEKYPLALERSLRLSSILNDIYQRQHGISLRRLLEVSKRECRAYLDSLEGMPAFAACRVCVVSALGNGVPVDERLRDLLAAEHAVDPAATPEACAAWIEKLIKPEDALETHLLLQAWSDEHGHPPKRERRTVHLEPEHAAPLQGARAKAPRSDSLAVAAKSRVTKGDAAQPEAPKARAKPR